MKNRVLIIRLRGLLASLILVFGSFLVLDVIYSSTIRQEQNIVIGILAIWAFLAYIVIPRVHRKLTTLYLPNYYIGRSQTSDGILGDPINLLFNGNKQQLISTMKQAGWIKADELSWQTSLGMVQATLTRKSYPSAPVSSLFVFGNKQDFAFQKEVGGTTSKRHHIRFWKTPPGWHLPGGHQADWVAAATFDRQVGFSAFTGQITHKIEADIDKERDYVITTLQKAKPVADVTLLENFTSGYHTRNGGGDYVKTDGTMPVVDLK